MLNNFQEHLYIFIMFHLVSLGNGDIVKVWECIEEVLFVDKFISGSLEGCDPISYPKWYSGKLL